MKIFPLFLCCFLVGCVHVPESHVYTPGIVCASVYVYGVESSVFIGADKKQGKGITCSDAYEDYRQKN